MLRANARREKTNFRQFTNRANQESERILILSCQLVTLITHYFAKTSLARREITGPAMLLEDAGAKTGPGRRLNEAHGSLELRAQVPVGGMPHASAAREPQVSPVLAGDLLYEEGL
ncbi:hypothetical protein NA57DRAFT_52919 [Rhizodiscina lignyota]|uniref:Uncharacterized protein n=1 Tax=Rhizodiscina lignyota TaxID=1504668 RepID=A0A9P4IPP3_9PEZI|nr:hypothetical protein NA57DRAFT_52919 [Rhizodiscina lignyota]